MKLAILSDFHLGNERFTLDAFTQALQAMAMAVEEADAVLVPGDIFDSRVPKPEALAQAIELFNIPREKEWRATVDGFRARDGRQNGCRVPVVAIHGTHEVRPKLLVNPVQLLEKGGFFVNAHAASVNIRMDGETVAITGMGGVPEAQAKAAIEAIGPAPAQGAYNIFLFHQSLKELLPVGDECLSVDDLPNGFDAYVCGHMHKSLVQKLNGKLLAIPGSTVVTQLKKEEESTKGYLVLDTLARQTEFRKIGSRPFFLREIRLENAGAAEAEGLVRKTVSELAASAKNPIIRVKVGGSLKNGLAASSLSFEAIKKEFSESAFVTIDKNLDSGIEEKVRRLRAAREEGASVRELGMELLRARLAENGFSQKIDCARLFELLSSSKRDAQEKALSELLGAFAR